MINYQIPPPTPSKGGHSITPSRSIAEVKLKHSPKIPPQGCLRHRDRLG